MRNRLRITLAGLGLSAGLIGCTPSSPYDPIAALFDLRAETLQRVYSIGGQGNRTDEIMTLLNRTMLSAQSTLYCSFEDVNMPWVIQALLFHRNRGIDVRVGIDEDNKDGIGYTQLASFLDANPQSAGRRLFVGNGGSGNVYQNICVADGIRVWVSSIPPTLPAAYQLSGFAFYIQSGDDGLARKFAVELDLVTHGSFGSTKQRLNRRNHWLVGDVDVGVYMAPSESPLASFVAPRVKGARQSVVVFGSEFFANNVQSSSSTQGKIREPGDVAYDMSHGSAAFRQATGGWFTYRATDPEVEPEGGTQGIEVDGQNSMQYLKARGNVELLVHPGDFPTNGMQIVLLDSPSLALSGVRTQNRPMAIIMTNPISTRADSSHDGVMFVFENATLIDEITRFYGEIRNRSVSETGIGTTGQSVTTANQREVVISELNWMGGYNNSGSTSSTARDYFELYNNTSSVINISRWRIQCTAAGAWANDCTAASPSSCLVILPDRTLIGPGQYFLVARKSNTFVSKSSLELSSGEPNPANECDPGNGGTCLGRFESLGTSFDQCRLLDPNMTVVDTVGVSGSLFSSDTNRYGLNDTTNLNRRSMERKTLSTDGTSASNWQTNASTTINNYNIRADYSQRSYGTPGYANGQEGLVLQSATPTSATSLKAAFSAAPDAGSAANAANYCIGLGTDTTSCSNVLSVSEASVDGTTVTLTTAAQTRGSSYKLFVNNVTSATGAALIANTASFTGYFVQATIVLNEVADNETRDLIELYVVSGGSLLGYELYEGTGVNLLTFPDAEVSTGDYIVVHMASTMAPGETDETSSKTQATHASALAGAWDYWSADSGIFNTDQTITLRSASTGAIVDAVIYADNSGGFGGTGQANAVSAGQWTQAGGSFVESDAVNTATAAGSSYQQISNGSTNNGNNTRWQVRALTIGGPNGFSVTGATGSTNTSVQVTFNEAPTAGAGGTGSENTANYRIAASSDTTCATSVVNVTGAALAGSIVTLTTASQTPSTAYRVCVSNVTAQSDGSSLSATSATFTGSGALFSFTNWTASGTVCPGGCPSGMNFRCSGTLDPDLSATIAGSYTGATNVGATSLGLRGEAANGISISNAGTASAICHTGAANGFMAGLDVALNTTGKTNIRVSWSAAQIADQGREYGLRLQYSTDGGGSFNDVTGPVEFSSVTAGTSTTFSSFGPTTLPVAAENNANLVLRWRYYYISGASGSRTRIAIDEISVLAD